MKINHKTSDKIATIVFYCVAGSFVVLLLLFIGYVLFQGKDRLNLKFITSPPAFMQEGGGIAPELFNSVYLVFLSMLIIIPIGLSSGIYLAKYAKPSRVTAAVRFCIEALASLPSVVVGLFGLLVFVSMSGWGYSLMAGALAVSVLNLPTITRVCEDSIRAVPDSYQEASLALGATHWQTIRRVIVPAALPGIITGIVMTASRAFGEAAALMYTAGMSSPVLDFSNWNPFSYSSPLNPFRPAETLAVYIWKVNSEGLAPDARQIADGSAAVLIISVFVFNILARWLGSRLSRKFYGNG